MKTWWKFSLWNLSVQPWLQLGESPLCGIYQSSLPLEVDKILALGIFPVQSAILTLWLSSTRPVHHYHFVTVSSVQSTSPVHHYHFVIIISVEYSRSNPPLPLCDRNLWNPPVQSTITTLWLSSRWNHQSNPPLGICQCHACCPLTFLSSSSCSFSRLSRCSMSLWRNHLIMLRDATHPVWAANPMPSSLHNVYKSSVMCGRCASAH